MRISTRQLYDLSQQSMTRSAESAYDWQRKISSGQRIDRASDDPAAAGRAVILNTRQSRIDMLKGNQDYAQTSLSEIDTALNAMQTQLAVLQEVTTQAGNGTLSGFGYDALKARAGQAVSELRNLANQKDSAGRLYFSDATSLEVQTGFSVSILLDRTSVLGAGADANSSELITAANAIVTALDSKRVPSATELSALKTVTDRLTLARTNVGLDSNSVENARSTLDASQLGLTQERSDLLDTDIAQGVTEFSRSQTMLQAARSLFSRIDSTGLFGMLR